jgi:replicative DNA helicase
MPQNEDKMPQNSYRNQMTQPSPSTQSMVDMERAILGALLVDFKEGMSLALDAKLKAEDFYIEAHGLIFSAILSLWNQNKKIDIFTVGQRLVDLGQASRVGGRAFLSELWDNSGVPANISDYAKVIVEKSIGRQLMGICVEVTEKCKDPTEKVEETLDFAEAKVFSLRENQENKGLVFLPDSVHGVLSHVMDLHKNAGNGLSGLPTGYKLLDFITGGFQASDMIILGGRPGMGKTSLALNFAVNAAMPYRRQDRSDMPAYSVAIFSMEMSTEQLIQRLMCQIGGYNLSYIRSGRLTSKEMTSLNEVVTKLMQASIYIDDTPALRPLDIRSKARRLMRSLSAGTYPLKMIVVDYLQLMRPDEKHSNLEQSVREISGSLKALAKELNIVVLALSQLKRPENVSKPDLSDLRDSGAIEQDADIVAFIVRDELAKPDTNVPEGQAHLTIRKHRNGPTGKIQLYFNKDCSSFEPTSLVDVPDQA